MNKITEVQRVDLDFIKKIVDEGLLTMEKTGKKEGIFQPTGLFLAVDIVDNHFIYVACDNSTGNAYIEEFTSEDDALCWLKI